ncbi:MAG: sigma-54-dependent Fis family transcriptional regulator [Gemmatimonadetes bacterium]|nr:sigma-54-dependent Fis family transcriptional regulator [Gemmatimonadota bacterium]
MVGSILLVDDDPEILSGLGKLFERLNWEVLRAGTGREALDLYDARRPDVVLLDLYLPDITGLDLLQVLSGRGATVVMLTGHADVPTAVEAVKAGAENFLAKPVDLAHLQLTMERALEQSRRRERDRYFRERSGAEDLAAGLGVSPVMREIAEQALRVAEADRTTVLLLGESGTGKGWLAERIHSHSPRAKGPFVTVNCASLTGDFLASELFGHEKGAFTGAKTLKRGLLEIAHGGTLLLDQIAELDPGLQPRLLNVLETRTFRRLGGTQEIEVDVRLIGSSNRNLQADVGAGRFREDLFYRLNVVTIELPPLRRRGPEDIADLAQRLLAELEREMPRGPAQLHPQAGAALQRHSWPGNVRELRNVLERARILAGDAELIRLEHLPAEIRALPLLEGGDARDAHELANLEEIERRHIRVVLERAGGNRTRAAAILGISRATLHSKIKRYGLETVGLEAAR